MKSLTAKKHFNPLPIVIVMIFFTLILLYPKDSYHAALSGLDVFLSSVFPALLPFFIVSELMIGLGIIDFLSILLNPLMQPLFRCSGKSSFVWIMSATSGYPAGARLVAILRKDKKIGIHEAQRILSFCSTSGPLFMIGAVAIGMLGTVEGGTIILASHYLSAIILGLVFRFYKSKNTHIERPTSLRLAISSLKPAKREIKPFGELMSDAVNNAINILMAVGGFIILFSVVINLLIKVGFIEAIANIIANLLNVFNLDIGLLNGVIGGIFEITIGSKIISQSLISLQQKIVAVSFIIGWSGFSINAQAAALLSGSGVNIGLYMLTKLLHGAFAAIISYFASSIFFPESIQVFKPEELGQTSWGDSLVMSFYMLCISLVFLFLVSTISYVVYNTRRKAAK